MDNSVDKSLCMVSKSSAAKALQQIGHFLYFYKNMLIINNLYFTILSQSKIFHHCCYLTQKALDHLVVNTFCFFTAHLLINNFIARC